MNVKLLEHTHLSSAVIAARTCWNSFHKGGLYDYPTNAITEEDKTLLSRLLFKNKHESIFEHIVYVFNILGIPRLCLQELARHRIASYKGVKSDNLKHIIPESYLTDLVMTINVRSLRNFLQLRLSKSAHKSIRALANEMLTSLSVEHLFLYKDLLEENKND